MEDSETRLARIVEILFMEIETSLEYKGNKHEGPEFEAERNKLWEEAEDRLIIHLRDIALGKKFKARKNRR